MATHKRSHTGAEVGRLFGDWMATNQSADANIYGSLSTLRARCRSLERENPYFARWLAELEANVLGDSGIRLTMDCRTKKGTKDKRVNKLIEGAWREFSKRGNFTADKQLDRVQWSQVALRSVARDGDFVAEFVRGFPRNDLGFAVANWEADHLDHSNNDRTKAGNPIRLGVERDTWGAHVAYHIDPEHPGDSLLDQVQSKGRRRRVPAEGYSPTMGNTAIMPFLMRRFSQTRGEPWGSVAIRQLRQLGMYEEAALVNARVGAAKMGLLFEPGDGAGADGAYEGRRTMNAEPGSIEVIPVSEPGEVQFEKWDPSDPNADYPDFRKGMLRGILAGLLTSYNVVGNDLEGVSFSSIRQSVLSEREIWKMLQNWYIQTVEAPTFHAWLDWAVMTGALPLAYSELSRWACPSFEGRRWDWVDPLKDVKAAEMSINLGLSSRQRENRKKGQTFTEVSEEQAEDNQEAAQMGLDFSESKPEPAPPAKKKAKAKD